MVNKHSKLMGLLLIVLVASALISLGIGRYALSLEQILQILTAKLTALPIDPIHQQVIFQVRLPRILSALCVGAGLALSGAALQGIFRNPLVDPHIIALGVKVRRLRWLVIGLSGTLVACQVAISGSIGWVGLIIPHISRMLVGANHQRLLPCTMLVGAIYMLWVDNAARALTDNEIPISILTALIGAPLFGILVYRLKRNGAMRD